METIILKIKLDEGATIPSRGSAQAAGLDLYATEDVVLQSMERKLVMTGVHVEIPDGCLGWVMGRSGNSKRGLWVATGLVDSDYRGAIGVNICNISEGFQVIKKGDRIAQLVVQEYPYPKIVQCDELSNTERGSNGFGSTDK